jgi:putative PIN family toxin of toxin-antitoxin system
VTRAVVDSSVLVSALIAPRDTPPSQVLRALGARALRAGRQPQLIAEVTGVLARPKFDCYVTPEEFADFLDVLRSDAVVHPDPAVIERATRDAHDDYLVALAKAAGAVLVSSDRDVLEADIGAVEVLNAREFLDRLAWRPEPFSQPDALGDALGSRLRVRRCSATAARPIRGTARPLLVTWFTSDSTCGAGRKVADASAARDRVMPARRLLSRPRPRRRRRSRSRAVAMRAAVAAPAARPGRTSDA